MGIVHKDNAAPLISRLDSYQRVVTKFFNACFSDMLILVNLGDQMVSLSISVLTNLKKAEILRLDLGSGNDTDFFFSFEPLMGPCACP